MGPPAGGAGAPPGSRSAGQKQKIRPAPRLFLGIRPPASAHEWPPADAICLASAARELRSAPATLAHAPYARRADRHRGTLSSLCICASAAGWCPGVNDPAAPPDLQRFPRAAERAAAGPRPADKGAGPRQRHCRGAHVRRTAAPRRGERPLST
eukprot:scaffold19505_cov96-Isochrysis_galbana.AAC.1